MLSVVIVNWNTCEHLRRCLQSLKDNAPPNETEVIVVDNASTDGSASMVRSEFETVKLLAQTANLGYAAGNNIGIEAATGHQVLLLNPDTIIRPGSIPAALQALEEQSEGIVSVQFILPDGSIQRSIRGVPTISGIKGAWAGLDKLFPNSPLGSYTLPNFDYTVSQFCPQPMGTFLLLSKKALDEVKVDGKVLDEQFPIFFNEVDLLYRMAQRGRRAYFLADVAIDHVHGAGTGQNLKNMIWESHRSLNRYFHKHLKGVKRVLLPLIAVISYAVALIRAKGIYAGFRP